MRGLESFSDTGAGNSDLYNSTVERPDVSSEQPFSAAFGERDTTEKTSDIGRPEAEQPFSPDYNEVADGTENMESDFLCRPEDEQPFSPDFTMGESTESIGTSEGEEETAENNPAGMLEKLDTDKLQEIADNTAKEYNEQKRPFEKAEQKGLEGVTQTENGGVSFYDSPYIYKTEDGEKAEVSIKATGSRTKDFDAANKAIGLDETPEGYVWHHLDDYNVKDGTVTLQLVKDDAHKAVVPHAGGCAQFDAVNGPSYNPVRKEALNV